MDGCQKDTYRNQKWKRRSPGDQVCWVSDSVRANTDVTLFDELDSLKWGLAKKLGQTKQEVSGQADEMDRRLGMSKISFSKKDVKTHRADRLCHLRHAHKHREASPTKGSDCKFVFNIAQFCRRVQDTHIVEF